MLPPLRFPELDEPRTVPVYQAWEGKEEERSKSLMEMSCYWIKSISSNFAMTTATIRVILTSGIGTRPKGGGDQITVFSLFSPPSIKPLFCEPKDLISPLLLFSPPLETFSECITHINHQLT